MEDQLGKAFLGIEHLRSNFDNVARLVTIPRIPPVPSLNNIKIPLHADTVYGQIKDHIKSTQKELKDDEQLLVIFCNKSGEKIPIHDIGYHNPSLILLYGTAPDGSECNLLVHMASLELDLRVVKLTNLERQPIGFLA